MFVDNFVSSHDGGIIDPTFALFGPDGNLYVGGDNRILRFDGTTGLFLNDFVMRGVGGLNLSGGFTFDSSQNSSKKILSAVYFGGQSSPLAVFCSLPAMSENVSVIVVVSRVLNSFF